AAAFGGMQERGQSQRQKHPAGAVGDHTAAAGGRKRKILSARTPCGPHSDTAGAGKDVRTAGMIGGHRMEQKIPLVVIAGPTASGKTAAGVYLAKQLNGEVVSA